MTDAIRRWFRLLGLLVLAGSLVLTPVTTARAQAQPGAEGEEEESTGRVLDGYLLMVMLASGAFFVVGKTARR